MTKFIAYGAALAALIFSSACTQTPRENEKQQVLSSIRQLDAEIDNFKFELHSGKMDSEILDQRVKEQNQTLASLENRIQSVRKASEKLAKEEVKKLNSEYSSIRNDQEKLTRQVTALEKSFKQSSDLNKKLQDEVQQVRKDIAELSQAMRSLSGILSTPSKTTYQVQKGDSLGLIASKYNISVEKIKKANNLKKDVIYVGQKLIIPTNPS